MEEAAIPVTFSPNAKRLECVEVIATQDNVIEDDESFRVQLILQTVLPASLRNHLKIGMSSATITIQDTSKLL